MRGPHRLSGQLLVWFSVIALIPLAIVTIATYFAAKRALNDQVTSPSRYAKRVEEPLAVVSYHFRELLKADCLEIAHEAPRGDLTEHYYRATRRALFDGVSWESLPETIRNT